MAEKVSEVVQVGIVNKPGLPDTQEVTIPDPETDSVNIFTSKSPIEKTVTIVAQPVSEQTCKTTKPVTQPDHIIPKHIVHPEGLTDKSVSHATNTASISNMQSARMVGKLEDPNSSAQTEPNG
eukprot:813057_1